MRIPAVRPDLPVGRRRSANSVELVAGFELEESRAIWGSTQAPGRGAIGSRGADARRDDRVRSPTRRPAGRDTTLGLPHPGDELAGFRIILELGRGAFARVYLAEEVNLGRRPVAIKVSRPDGDEPQILARLQHTHIVPVHSVSDDPDSGLRVLCMPYFGGANLAQVLEAAGGLVPTHHDGRSLVKALDQVSRNFSSESSRAIGSWLIAAGLGRRGPSRSSSAAPVHPLDSPKACTAQAASRFRSLFSRWVGPARPAAGRGGPEEHEDGPITISRRASFCTAPPRSRRPSGSWPAWPTGSSMPIRADCCIAT